MDSPVLVEKRDTVEQPSSEQWEEWRKLSLLPGGFGDDRVNIWPKLLHAGPSSIPAIKVESPTPLTATFETQSKDVSDLPSDSLASETRPQVDSEDAHRDEHQIGLDTDRSFVFYPVGSLENRHRLQVQLHELLVSIFRKRRKLSYFQGYHDIITVLYLTLPCNLQLSCSESLSLQRVRDSMGSTLEPVLGLLRILKNLLKCVDPAYAALLEQTSPLPFHALSNLLTLFAHDVPTLALIQHVFDWLLCRPPIAVVYLAAAVLVSRKQEVERLEAEGEEGMIHSLLSGLPPLSDGEEDTEKPEMRAPMVNEDTGHHHSAKTEENAEDHVFQDHSQPTQIGEAQPPLSGEKASLIAELTSASTLAVPIPAPVFGSLAETEPIITDSDTPSGTAYTAPCEADLEDNNAHPAETPISSPSRFRPQSQSRTSSSSSSFSPPAPTIALSYLLTHADELYASYPPSHPSIALDTIMGPNSVMRTWNEDLTALPDGDAAEDMVLDRNLLVFPFIEPEPEEDKEHLSKDKQEQNERRRRKLKKARFSIEKRTMVAGAILVLGVSMAVYGMRAKDMRSHGHAHGVNGRPWRKFGGQVAKIGSSVLGAGERIIDSFGIW